MNVNSLIISTLKPLVSTVVPNNYSGTADTYIVFNYADDRGGTFADDMPQDDIASIQIHLFCPGKFDYMTLKKQIRSKLFEAGFSYPSVQTFYEKGSTPSADKNHIVFECEIEGQSETEV
jgi:hypothetical protein